MLEYKLIMTCDFFLVAGGEEGRPSGWSSANPSRTRNSGMPFNSGTLSRQKNPASSDPSLSREVSIFF